jgi:uncharacterized membrane protein
MKKIYNYLFSNKEVFAKGLCKEKIFFVFLFGCVFGCIYEESLNIIFSFINNGYAVWETRRGLIYGELSPIYGWGAALMTYILMIKNRKWYHNFILGSLIGGGFEYLISFLQETFTGSVSWNYSNEFLNINGRTTIPYMMVWGLLALLLIYIIYPFLSHLIELIPYNLGMILYKVLFIMVSIDMFISFGAVIRQYLRRLGYAPFTILGNIFDKYYPDSRLARVYTNAVEVIK